MSKKAHALQQEPSALPALIRTVRILSGLASAVAAYLVVLSLSGWNAVGCGPDSGCQEVLHGRWAYWLGIPVSVLGLLAYATLFGTSFLLGTPRSAEGRRRAWAAVWTLSLLILGAALWFFILQWVVLKKFCPYCLGAHGLASLAAILAIRAMPWSERPEKSWQQEKWVYVPPALGRRLALGCAGALTLMVFGQVLHQPRTFLVKETRTGTSVTTNQLASRVLQLLEGHVSLQLHEVPLHGRMDAPHIMVGLHDYTCPGCRSMHEPLKQAQRAYSNELAIVGLPMPLDAACNHLVRQTHPKHSNACQYATISLAVWRAKRSVFEQFEDYLFTGETPPPLPEAFKKAQQLVGESAFNRAMADPWVTNQLGQDIEIYAANMRLNRSSSMPQLFLGSTVAFGSMPQADLFQRITNAFRLPLRLPPP